MIRGFGGACAGTEERGPGKFNGSCVSWTVSFVGCSPERAVPSRLRRSATSISRPGAIRSPTGQGSFISRAAEPKRAKRPRDSRSVAPAPRPKAAFAPAPVQRHPNLDHLPLLRQLGGADGFHVEKLRSTSPRAENRVTAKMRIAGQGLVAKTQGKPVLACRLIDRDSNRL